MEMTERVGIFGGTFDPIHIGHLVVADTMRVRLNLTRVMFLPAGLPPHKPHQNLSSDDDRLAMLGLVMRSDSHFEISRIDIDRAGPSYTADSLGILRSELPIRSEIFFLMGVDSLRDLPSWHDPARIVTNARLAVASRPGVSVDVDSIIQQIPESRERIDIVDVPLIGVSSSGIREMVRCRGPFRYLVLPAVADYITSRNLYRTDHDASCLS